MKKWIVYLVVIASVFFLSGCFDKNAKQKEAMKKYAVDYYNSYGASFTEIDEYSISLEQLRDSVKTLGKKYDLSSLESCNADSKIIFSVKDGKITDTEYKLNC